MTNAVLVLGAGGFVGRHLVTTLLARGHRIIALTRSPNTFPAGVETLSGDFNTPEDFAPLLSRADTIVHAASGSTPGSTAGKPLVELDINLRPTLALLTALQDAQHCRLLYISSGGTLYGDTHERPVQENSELRPRSYYGAGKAATEHFIHAAAQQFNLSTTILRPSNLYGPGQGLRSGFGIIPTAFTHAQTGTPLTLWGDGHAIRDYLYIDDFIRLCGDILETPMPNRIKILNAASGQGISLLNLIDHIRRVTGAPLPVQYNLSRSVDIARIVLDTTEITRASGWTPQIELEDGLRRTWHWWQAQQA